MTRRRGNWGKLGQEGVFASKNKIPSPDPSEFTSPWEGILEAPLILSEGRWGLKKKKKRV